ncbi:MAG: pitrilysin family protein [Bacteroidota bacterium]
MANYHHFVLENGLKVYVIHDPSVSTAVTNLIYNVGSRDESPDKTGFAHLFEHLMFGGSRNIANFDQPLQRVGGSSNAFTSPDITNYYVQVPAVNLETAFWLESDRMLSLSFDPKVLEVQRSVVIEEFKQRYLNQPYGDLWLKFRPLAYKQHPYRWATIGKEIAHIEEATMADVEAFFHKFYHPGNATLVVGGPTPPEEVRTLAEKWFGPIPAGETYQRDLPTEPEPTTKRSLSVDAQVPVPTLYMGFPMASRFSTDYHEADLLSDVLGRGESARLHQALVNEHKLFNSISGFVMGSLDPGLLMISGRLLPGVSPQDAEAGIWEVIEELKANPPSEAELTKVKNQAESTLIMGQIELLNRCTTLAQAANAGYPDYPFGESEHIQAVSSEAILEKAQSLLRPERSVVMHYG